MTQQTYPNSQEAASSSSSGSVRSSTSTADAFPLPFSIGQKKIMDDDGRLVANLADNNVVAPAANICVNDSSHITFGNRTIFNEGVTIYQYIDGNHLPQLQNDGTGQDEVECNKSVIVVTPESKSDETTTTNRSKIRKFYVILAIMVLCLLGGVIIAVKISRAGVARTETTSEPTKTTPPTSNTMCCEYVYRNEWNAREPKNSTKISSIKRVVTTYTGGEMCNTSEQCRARVKELQRENMDKHQMPDIRYNFLIGGDGLIYEGRGWFIKNEGLNDSMDIAFIGNFSDATPSENMNLSLDSIIVDARWKEETYNEFGVVHLNQILS